MGAMPERKRIILAITGASGAIYGIRALQMLSDMNIETHLIISPAGEDTIAVETEWQVDRLHEIATQTYRYDQIDAPVASGSYPVDGMLVAPCSIKTLSAIANSYSDNLIVRAADVCLKEGHPVILAVRETPFHPGHLRLMTTATEAGAIIFPPIPSFYHHPKNIQELIDDTSARMLLRLGISNPYFKKWK